MGKCQGVILAAGHGSRMGPFGNSIPKTIVPICNKPLLVYQIEQMKSVGIEDIIIVIGHLGHIITQALGDGSRYGVRIRYVEQQNRLGIAHALGQLESYLDSTFMLILGDSFLELSDLEQMFRVRQKDDCAAVLGVADEADEESIKLNYAVILREDGFVQRVIEKPRHFPSRIKGLGLYLFDQRIFEAIRRTPRTAMRDEYELTDSIQILINYEYPVRVAPVVDWDVNLTYIGDLIRCCRHQLKRLGKDSLVGENCRIAEGTTLRETVIGDNVTIAQPTTLERCVVLSDVVVNEAHSFSDTVFTKDSKLDALDCN